MTVPGHHDTVDNHTLCHNKETETIQQDGPLYDSWPNNYDITHIACMGMEGYDGYYHLINFHATVLALLGSYAYNYLHRKKNGCLNTEQMEHATWQCSTYMEHNLTKQIPDH